MTGEKVREIRLRRMADRQGLKISKSRRRDPRAVDYGQWTVTQGRRRVGTYQNLDEIEQFLTSGGQR